MNFDELKNELKNILEEEELYTSDVLVDYEYWDSLTVLSILALLDSNYKITLTSDDLDNCSTFGDLLNLVEENYNS